ncbi:hypothetical protein [Streptomyces sp. NBC_00258]|uniref:hypothetical protein n=1 Tax=Streptomyces sp. NBC_00258 TaxID=2903642 RepID=UPI002E2D3373|nr:hypothetical protein [Streptomyces sp. NBC_00258]
MIPEIVFPLAALLGAVGLRVIAPRRAPGMYLAPAACTVALLALATACVVAAFR